jgi:hypothetical protein
VEKVVVILALALMEVGCPELRIIHMVTNIETPSS